MVETTPGHWGVFLGGKSMRGLYVHTHWAYNRPYAARTWTLDDWKAYLKALRLLGYDLVHLWPQLDCMPVEPTDTDVAYLKKIGDVIDYARTELGMKFAVIVCPNTIGNEKSSRYTYETRPYFVCEWKVNPSDPEQMKTFLRGRDNQLKYLAKADMLVIIDSDPGGYIGSTNEEFVSLMEKQLAIVRRHNSDIELNYWMLMGWENYNRFWAETSKWKPGDPHPAVDWASGAFVETLGLMKERIQEPWALFAYRPVHREAIDKHGLREKCLYYPYGAIEGEPTFPLTNLFVDHLAEVVGNYSREEFPRGIMGNAQTHCVQLPNIYLFSHFARRETRETVDLGSFAERLLPGLGEKVAKAWQLIPDAEPALQREGAKGLRTQVGKPHGDGPFSGFLFGDPDRFLSDLADTLDIRARCSEFRNAVEAGSGFRAPLRELMEVLVPYQKRIGFADAYYGYLAEMLNAPLWKLNLPEVRCALEDFANWKNPPARHGVVTRLFEALKKELLLP